MPAITIADLSNAKLDVAHIAEVANSTLPTAVDRFGTRKKTLASAIDSIKSISNKGAWAAQTAYVGKDIVSDAGTWYICVVDHTSGATFASDKDSKWRVFQGVMQHELSEAINAVLGGGSAGADKYSIASAGFTAAQYQATPIAVINATLAYALSDATAAGRVGAVVHLPDVPVTIKVGQETGHSYTGPARIIIPAVQGFRWLIVGGGQNSPIFYDTSLQNKTVGNGRYTLMSTGDQATGKGGWDFCTRPNPADTDPASMSFDATKMLDAVIVKDLVILGDEPDGYPGIVQLAQYEYQMGGMALMGAKSAAAIDCTVNNVLNSAIVLGFSERMVAKGCRGRNIGHRKAPNQPANFVDIIGLGADYKIKSSAVIFDCHGERVHDVSYMTIWCDTTVTHSTSTETAIHVENQGAWATTARADVGGNVFVDKCVFDGNITSWTATNAERRLADAIIMNGGVRKSHVVRDTVIRNQPNMAVAGYTDGSNITLDNLVLENIGTAGFSEFPVILWSNGKIHITGGEFRKVQYSLVQLLGTAELSWGARTPVVDAWRSLIHGKGDSNKFQMRVEIKDGSSPITVGSPNSYQYNYDLDVLLTNFIGDKVLSFRTWDNLPVTASGKMVLDFGGANQHALPIASYFEGSSGYWDVSYKNRAASSVNVSAGFNCEHGYVHEAGNLYVNRFNPLKGTLCGVDMVKEKFTGIALTDTLTNVRSAHYKRNGLTLVAASVLGAPPGVLPYDPAQTLQVTPARLASLNNAVGWTVFMETGPLGFLEKDPLNKTRNRSLFAGVADVSNRVGSTSITATWWEAQGREEVIASVGDTSIWIDQDPTKPLRVALCVTTSEVILSVNGRSVRKAGISGVPSLTGANARMFIGMTPFDGFSSLSQYFDPRTPVTELGSFALVAKPFTRDMLERITDQGGAA